MARFFTLKLLEVYVVHVNLRSGGVNREKKRKGIKGSKIRDFIFYLSHRKTVLSRGT
jgi:hypothetical protein